MNEVQKIGDIPSATSLSKTGVKAIGFSAAGIFVMLLNAIPITWLGLVVGGIVTLFGIASFRSKDPADKKAGIIITAAGALTILSRTGIPFFTPVSNVLLGVGAFGLLALGILNAIKFFIGLRKRA